MKTNTPADAQIAVGQRHRTFRVLSAQVYDYDALGVQTRALAAGTVFQPWEPQAHWRGERVPITLGDASTQFDWGVTAGTGLFLHWDDYFAYCGTGDAPPVAMQPPGERWPSSFAELTEISRRLREGVDLYSAAGKQLQVLLTALEDLAQQDATAAQMEIGAMGTDNMMNAAMFANLRVHLLASARSLLEACRALRRA